MVNDEAQPATPRPRTLTRLGWWALSLARGMALFLGVYAALSLLRTVLRGAYNANQWWIDLYWAPSVVSIVLQAAVVVVLLAFAFRVPRNWAWRIISTVVCLGFAGAALNNALNVYRLHDTGAIHLGYPVPFSLFIMGAFVIIAAAVALGRPVIDKLEQSRRPARLKTTLVVGFAVLLSGAVFPLGQVFCFGLTDYRTPVDAVVVLGAQAYSDGSLSPMLTRRVESGIRLYQEGRTQVLIMSGGVGDSGVNEAEVMKNYAVKRGVPADAILVDGNGNNTRMTVDNSLALAQAHGLQRLGTTSSYYHMARIKMQFLSAGANVVTVPADTPSQGDWANNTRGTIREIPAWWYYWFRGIFV